MNLDEKFGKLNLTFNFEDDFSSLLLSMPIYDPFQQITNFRSGSITITSDVFPYSLRTFLPTSITPEARTRI